MTYEKTETTSSYNNAFVIHDDQPKVYWRTEQKERMTRQWEFAYARDPLNSSVCLEEWATLSDRYDDFQNGIEVNLEIGGFDNMPNDFTQRYWFKLEYADRTVTVGGKHGCSVNITHNQVTASIKQKCDKINYSDPDCILHIEKHPIAVPQVNVPTFTVADAQERARNEEPENKGDSRRQAIDKFFDLRKEYHDKLKAIDDECDTELSKSFSLDTVPVDTSVFYRSPFTSSFNWPGFGAFRDILPRRWFI